MKEKLRRLFSIILIVSTVCVIASNSIGGEIYKWVDDDGNVHYGDNPSQEASEELSINQAENVDEVNRDRINKLIEDSKTEKYSINRDGKEESVTAEELDSHLRGKWDDFNESLGKRTNSGDD